ncbi:MAG TPA: hypothetical protein VLF60_05115 [Candidatus Saccharimonadales bacterium]|nr:hypothetical protein [Candidatus Saccharimonadales bacterium]
MTQTDDTQADGYYGDDDMGTDDLDLSFLDDDDEEVEAKPTSDGKDA